MAATHVYSVSDLIRQINLDLFRYNDVSVEGEVTNFTRSAAGHSYFSIKDARAQMRVVLFSQHARLMRFRIENGLQLIVRGRLTVYEAKGEFQMNAVAAEPAGLGALQLAFEQLKKRLAEEGLFAPERKKPIPMLPQRIAVVTSPTGAAVRDVLNVLGRRFSDIEVQIYPVRVQGANAGREIATALRHLSRWKLHDVILICRGGGSLEDLWAFNEEVVARAVAECELPTISGVGHETDFTICDFVADLRAPTPSAAAEIVVRAKSEICMQIDHMTRRVKHVVEARVRAYRHELRHLASSDRLGIALGRVREARVRLDRRRHALDRSLRRHAERMRARLAGLDQPLQRYPERLALRLRLQRVATMNDRLVRAIRDTASRRRDGLASRVGTLEALSPLSVLSRGYAIAFTIRKKKRKPVLDSMQVQVGEAIEVQLKKGKLECTVDRHSLGLETLWPPDIPRRV
ncbi:MAG TPA: exodeoxyribonuclease VII large subunit [Thermoanaerobaculia bacterium]|jgi:exodeoxyribonuclease VII large subunit